MLIILSQTNNPFHNIATEEYLLKNFKEDIFFLYINSKSIIVGKHQNTLAEINYSFVNENNIPVIRRLSGGGTVFHDPGNINFCFITSGNKGELVNFKKHTTPIVNFLNSLNVNAAHGGRNDILIEGCKISGNACHVYKSRVMHHGTLLFNSKLKSLTNALKNDPLKFTDKAVKSVRSKVTNIYDHLTNKIEVDVFVNQLNQYIINNYYCTSYTLSNDDNKTIDNLVNEKFTTWEWNYGYSPKYELKKRIKSTSGKRFEIIFHVQKGKISEVKIKSNSTEKENLIELQEILNTSLHHYEDIKNKTANVFSQLRDLKQNELLDALF